MEFNKLFTTIDTHAGGEPLRIVTGGIPHLKGNTQWERADDFSQKFDHIRSFLMAEPRGHHGMVGCIITPPAIDDAHFGVLFMHNEGLCTMSGHGIIAAVTAWFETGQLRPEEADTGIRIDTPAGRVTAYAECEGTEVKSVSFDNVPSFIYASDVPITLNGFDFNVDISFGGAFYAIVEAKALGELQLRENELPDLQKWGYQLKREIEAKLSIVHPLEQQLNGIHGIVFTDSANVRQTGSNYRNVTVFANDQFDRSPGGAGVCAHMAVLIHRGKLKLGEACVHEGIVGTQIAGKVIMEANVGTYTAIIPRITGHAFITGFQNFVADATDPLAQGFLLR